MGEKGKQVGKLRKQNGESIVETLVAILIAALSCTILMTSVTAAVSINKNAAEAQEVFDKELLEAERQEEGEKNQITVSVILNSETASQALAESCDVMITGGNGKLTSFKLDPKEESR